MVDKQTGLWYYNYKKKHKTREEIKMTSWEEMGICDIWQEIEEAEKKWKKGLTKLTPHDIIKSSKRERNTATVSGFGLGNRKLVGVVER